MDQNNLKLGEQHFRTNGRDLIKDAKFTTKE